jgi:Nif-specific regulatory protein
MEETIVDRVMSMVDDYSFGSDVPIAGFSPKVSRSEEGLGYTLSAVMERVGADRGFIARSLGAGGGYRVAVTVGLTNSVGRDEVERLGSIDERTFMLKRPVLSVDPSRDGRFDSLRDGFLSGAASLMLVPFGVGENVEGFCYLDRHGEANRSPFLSTELEHLVSYSKYIALIVMAIERDELMKDNIYLKAQLDHTSGFENIITQDPRMHDIFGMVGRVRDSTIPVLLMGETGTGKELIARAIHFGGIRKKRKFVAINCAALPDNLLESELFGHRKGAFTGAIIDKKGMFEVADGGTFFLDEVSDMGLGIQAKLLRVLESGEIKRLGETTGKHVDVRVISATNRNLYDEVEAGRFREDLFYRLNGIRVEIPPLRERRADIPLLISHFKEKFSVEERKKISGISPEALNALLSYDWPGNVRELLNEIRRAVTLAKDGESIGLHLLSDRHRLGRRARGGEEGGDAGDTLPERTASFEIEQIRMALKEANGVKSRAARLLGIHESTLRFKMKRYRLDKNHREEWDEESQEQRDRNSIS